MTTAQLRQQNGPRFRIKPLDKLKLLHCGGKYRKKWMEVLKMDTPSISKDSSVWEARLQKKELEALTLRERFHKEIMRVADKMPRTVSDEGMRKNYQYSVCLEMNKIYTNIDDGNTGHPLLSSLFPRIFYYVSGFGKIEGIFERAVGDIERIRMERAAQKVGTGVTYKYSQYTPKRFNS